MKLHLLILLTVWYASAWAEVLTHSVDYTEGNIVLEGYVAVDTSVQGARPGVLIVHQWKGLTDYEKSRAQMLAKLGYVALAVDIYGKGIRPKDTKEAGALAGKYKTDRDLFRARLRAGLNELLRHENVDPKRIAAIGYCFGGTGVIELARTGADIAAVVSFHGGLDSPKPEDGRNIKAKVLALHGADDPFVLEKDILAFEDELRKAKVDWQLVKFGGAVHSFTEKDAGSMNVMGAAYNEAADRRSWAYMLQLFKEVF